jgi:hypothetical protein
MSCHEEPPFRKAIIVGHELHSFLTAEGGAPARATAKEGRERREHNQLANLDSWSKYLILIQKLSALSSLINQTLKD